MKLKSIIFAYLFLLISSNAMAGSWYTESLNYLKLSALSLTEKVKSLTDNQLEINKSNTAKVITAACAIGLGYAAYWHFYKKPLLEEERSESLNRLVALEKAKKTASNIKEVEKQMNAEKNRLADLNKRLGLD